MFRANRTVLVANDGKAHTKRGQATSTWSCPTSPAWLLWPHGDSKPLFPGLSKDKFTFQISDHLPLWMQMNTDNDGQQLDQIIRSRPMRKRG